MGGHTMSQVYWTSRKLASKLLLAGLLLTSCSTNTYANEFERYLSTIDNEYTLVTEKCDSQTVSQPYNIKYNDKTIGVYCWVAYYITPLTKTNDIKKDDTFFLVQTKLTKDYYFINKDYIINDNGQLVTFVEYFGGK